jgi:predicted RNA-binding protein YlqC (UPF0109 family)
MESLVRHLVEPIVQHPDAVSVQAVEGDAVTLYELVVHDDDRELFEADRGKTLRSIRNILSAAAGRQKASLDLVDEHGQGEE